MNNTLLTPDEVIAALRNSSLSTLIVEGRSDMELFHALEEICFASEIDIFPVGGREAVLEIFSRKAEFSKASVAFLADADLYSISGIPTQLKDVVFTEGYSIENDILCGGKAFRLISARHAVEWKVLLDHLAYWFESVVHRRLAGEDVTYRDHPSQFFNFETMEFTEKGRTLLVSGGVCKEANKISKYPVRFLRGHTLLDGLGHFLAIRKQKPKCSKDVLLRMDLVSWETNPSLARLITKLKRSLR